MKLALKSNHIICSSFTVIFCLFSFPYYIQAVIHMSMIVKTTMVHQPVPGPLGGLEVCSAADTGAVWGTDALAASPGNVNEGLLHAD